MQSLRSGELAQAIDLLSRAQRNNPDDPSTQLNLGIALQGTRRHAEAVEAFDRAQKALPQEPMPFLHASLSLLALSKAEAALQAAREACARAPELPQAHAAHGQALLALNEPERAEHAFAIALRHAPRWADAWVLCGAARRRQGAIEGAKAAMREALRHAPDHAVAKDNLAALMRMGGDEQAATLCGAGGSHSCRCRATRGRRTTSASARGDRKVRRPPWAWRSSFSARSPPSPNFNSVNGRKCSTIKSSADTFFLSSTTIEEFWDFSVGR